jgi:hypothetical protein
MYEEVRKIRMRSHEENDALGNFLPLFGHLIVFFLCHSLIQEKERRRAISSELFLLRLLLRLVWGRT